MKTFTPRARLTTQTSDRLEPFDPDEALRMVRRRTVLVPKTAIVLGSGLGVMAEGIVWEASLTMSEIPGIPRSTVEGHAGRLLFGRWAGRAVVVAQGRSHLYEGYSPEVTSRIVRLFAALGSKALVLTNAAGGITPRMTPGTLMLVEDSINLQWRSPGRGPGAVGSNPRGLRVRPIFSAELLTKAARAAVNAGVRVERGVLAISLGPSYETPAEIGMLERMGADAVCMSTAPEVAAANEIGLPVACLSCITNFAAGRTSRPLRHEDVTSGVAASATAIRSVLERLILALS